MKGYRTIVVNVLMFAMAMAANFGYEFSPDEQEIITGGIVGVFTLVNLVMRKLTTTPIGVKDEKT